MTLLWNRAAGALALVLGASCAGMTSNDGDAGMSDGGAADAAPVTIDGGPDGAVVEMDAGPTDVPDASAVDGPSGGIIVVRALGEGVGLEAEAYASSSGPLSIVPTAGTGCVITPHSAAGSRVVTATDLDLGSSLTLEVGSTTLSAPVGSIASSPPGIRTLAADEALQIEHEGTIFAYSASQALATQPFGLDWTITAAGSSAVPAGVIASSTLPGRVTQAGALTTPGSITAGSPAELAWTGGEGAQVFHIYAAGDDAAADCYAASDATSFVLTGDVTAALGAHAYGQVSAQSFHVVDIGGSQVLVIDQSDNLD